MQEFKKNSCLYRPYPAGTIHAPVQVRSTGHYRVPRGWEDRPLVKPFLELFWCISGTGCFGFGGAGWELNAGEVCFYFPGDRHEITANSDRFDYRWLTFDGPAMPYLIESFGLRRQPHPAPPPPVDLFQKLAAEIRDLGSDGEYSAGATAYEILTRAAMNRPEETEATVSRFKHLVELRYDDPALSVERLSAELGVHRSTLTRLVSRRCGMPPQEYLTAYRLQIAMRMLGESAVTIKEIAEATGFRDDNYFGKVFRRRIGQTPSQIRHTGTD